MTGTISRTSINARQFSKVTAERRFRPHRSTIVTAGVAWSICRSVCHDREPGKKWLNRSRCPLGCGFGWAEETIRWGPYPTWEGTFFEGKLQRKPPSMCGGDAAFCQITLTTCYTLLLFQKLCAVNTVRTPERRYRFALHNKSFMEIGEFREEHR